MKKLPQDFRREGTGFVFVVCQNGAESACRDEVSTSHSNLRLAFSRPGFVTFKLDPRGSLPFRFSLRSTLARTCGWSIGGVSGEGTKALIAGVCQRDELEAANCLHVYERDQAAPGTNGFEPGISPFAAEVAERFNQQSVIKNNGIKVNRIAKANQNVFDVVIVAPDQWWLGFHDATTVAGRWPGGVPLFKSDPPKISRAYLKLKEALQWSGLNVRPGDRCAEIGSAPGGACQLLLELGAHVTAIDPAELDPEIRDHPNLTYIRRRGREVKRRDLKGIKWLLADINAAPNYTLDAIADIVGHRDIHATGLILTLKLPDWDLVRRVPEYIERVKKMGFSVVKIRQLAFNRQELCLVAVRDHYALRVSRKSSANPSRS